MRHTLWVIMLGVASLGVSGCGKSDEAVPVAVAPTATPDSLALPQDVLQQFLNAIKTGQKDVAEKLLTTVARQRIAEAGIGMDDLSSSSASMSFEIHGVQLLKMPDNQEGAHVSCTLSDKLDDGKIETQNIIWGLRKETLGWRVAGMAWTPFVNEPPIFMDFEKPDEVIEKQKLLVEEQERRANPQATQPATTVAGVPGTGTPAAVQPNPGVAQPNPGAMQPNTGVVQAVNSTPAGTQPGTVNAPQQPVPPPQQVERFTAPAPLR